VSAATAAWAPLIRLRAGGGVTNLYPGPAHLLNGFHPSTRSGPRHQDRSRLSLTTVMGPGRCHGLGTTLVVWWWPSCLLGWSTRTRRDRRERRVGRSAGRARRARSGCRAGCTRGTTAGRGSVPGRTGRIDGDVASPACRRDGRCGWRGRLVVAGPGCLSAGLGAEALPSDALERGCAERAEQPARWQRQSPGTALGVVCVDGPIPQVT